jgi:uncharacterized protein (TIGR02246 family)
MHVEANVALSQGDPDKVMAIYANDVMTMPPNQAPLVGKPAVRAMREGFLSTYVIDASVSVEEVEVAGDLAFDRGSYRMKLTPKAGGPPIEDEGKYLDILRRQPDGSWKYARVSWSSSRPL